MAVVKLTAAWREAGKQAVPHDMDPCTGPVRIIAHIWKPRRGRYDPNNLWPTIKACVDGLVDAGLIADDDHTHVIGPDMRHGGTGPAQIILEIVPATTPSTG